MSWVLRMVKHSYTHVKEYSLKLPCISDSPRIKDHFTYHNHYSTLSLAATHRVTRQRLKLNAVCSHRGVDNPIPSRKDHLPRPSIKKGTILNSIIWIAHRSHNTKTKSLFKTRVSTISNTPVTFTIPNLERVSTMYQTTIPERIYPPRSYHWHIKDYSSFENQRLIEWQERT